MTHDHTSSIARKWNLTSRQVENTVKLIDQGATIPFIARYRKEQTGSLDEVIVAAIGEHLELLRELEKRKEYILNTIEGQGKLTPDLKKLIVETDNPNVLEDIYLPYKPKKRTRATIAKERGLEPLAKLILEQSASDLYTSAEVYINPEKGVESAEEALSGARDIVAEWVSENFEVRNRLRKIFWKEGILSCKVMTGKEEAGINFKDYYDYREPVNRVPSHRLLAIRRGEKEGFLSVDIRPELETAIRLIENIFIQRPGQASEELRKSILDSYKRLLKSSMETETRNSLKEMADQEAIRIFSANLRQLLMAAPLGEKRMMAIDPGFRTGCKVVCLDAQGKLLGHKVIYPNEPQKLIEQSMNIVQNLINQYQIEAIAIGNGTAGRETETFIRECGLPESILILPVNESGASVYSASEVAREEFPEHDVTVRGAVSIGRRLMDPLSELVKIDSKSIGVGQYQHDVDQAALKKSLDEVVISCVNQVGVELNTASKELLSFVSGLGPQLAGNIIAHREKYGAFTTRNDLKKVTRLGEKAFEQCAGFLRIRNSSNPLDRSAVHPERYGLVERIAADLNVPLSSLMEKEELVQKIDLKNYVSEEVGLPTLLDILEELKKPGRDPREKFEKFSFSEQVKDIQDLKAGMKLPGVVTNITKFGAFVDIGVHQDGLIHISQLSDRFVSDPFAVLSLQQQIWVTVLEVDISRKRISLSLKTGSNDKTGKQADEMKKREKDNGTREPGSLKEKLEQLKNKFQ